MRRGDRQELVFKALADPTRRRILDLVRDHALTTGQICTELFKLDRCTVMLHLGVLEKADLIIVRREGRFRWNYLNSTPIQRIYDRWIIRYARPSAELLTRLRADLELPGSSSARRPARHHPESETSLGPSPGEAQAG
jgi:DNA-binding transcriptional ArsR family regulator